MCDLSPVLSPRITCEKQAVSTSSWPQLSWILDGICVGGSFLATHMSTILKIVCTQCLSMLYDTGWHCVYACVKIAHLCIPLCSAVILDVYVA
jgi:hypothetical protein